MRLSELQTKKVISISTGRNIGTIMDVEVLDNGTIGTFFIEQNKSFFSLNRESDTQIRWSDIAKIGEDVILVKTE